jgi:hypothetical protein
MANEWLSSEVELHQLGAMFSSQLSIISCLLPPVFEKQGHFTVLNVQLLAFDLNPAD